MARLRRVAPFVVAALLLLLGYLRYAPGTAHAVSPDLYRLYSFPSFRYSDIIWTYLRDDLSRRPVPYFDYDLEYPPLTGILSYLASFAPGLPSYFAAVYAVLAACVLGTVAVLRRISGANPWYYAAAPALYLYTGSQWDPAAVFMTAVALLAFQRGRDRWGAVALTAAVWLKLFPFAFLAAVLVDRLRQRRFGAAFGIAGIFAAGTMLINLPFAVANWDGWSYFYTWNRTRLADAGFWVLFRDLSTAEATTLSLAAVILGWIGLAAVGLRARVSVTIPLGSCMLLWWLAVNKTFTPHLVLWVFLALALIRWSWPLWLGFVAIDIATFQLGSFLNLPNLPDYDNDRLVAVAIDRLGDPLNVLRSGVLVATVAWGALHLAVARREGFRQLGALARATVGSLASPDEQTGGATTVDRRKRSIVGGNGNGRTSVLEPVPSPPYQPPMSPTRWTTVSALFPDAPQADREWQIRWRWGALVTSAFALATVAMTWPYATHLGSATVIGMDPLLQIWLARWIQHALVTNPLHLFDSNLFYPFASTVAYTDANVPGALLAAPIQVITGNAILANSLLVIGTYLLAAGGMYALVTHLTRNRAAGLLAGLAFTFIPYRAIHLWHLNQLEHAWTPWVMVALLWLLGRPTWRAAIVFGVLLAVQALTSFYLAVQIGLVVGAVLLVALAVDPRAFTRRVLNRLAVGLALAAVLTVPFYLPYLTVREEQGLERSILEADFWKARPRSYFEIAPWDDSNPISGWLTVPGENDAEDSRRHPDGHRHAEITIEDGLFPGLIALVGAVIGIAGWRRRTAPTVMLLLIGGVAFVLSLGPTLVLDGGRTITLPYTFLFDHVELFKAMRVPARMGALVAFALVALAGCGAASAWERVAPRLDSVVRQTRFGGRLPGARRRQIVGAALTTGLAALILLELNVAPIPLETVDRSPAVAAPYEWLARQPDEGPVIEFPAYPIEGTSFDLSVHRHTTLSMYWSTLHWKPLVNGYSGFIPPAQDRLLKSFINDLPRPDGSIGRDVSFVDRTNVGVLQQLGVRYLLFHRDQYADRDWPVVLAQLEEIGSAIEKAGDFGEGTVYRLRNAAGTPPVDVTLLAPDSASPRTYWEPVLRVQKSGPNAALLYMKNPIHLVTTWSNESGAVVRRDEQAVPLPVVMPADQTQALCSIRGCTTTPADVPIELRISAPQQGDARLHPSAPGRYTVRLDLTGDLSASCDLAVEVVDGLPRAGANNWWTCREGVAPVPSDQPVLREHYDLSQPAVMTVDGHVALKATLTSRTQDDVRAWFFLTRPGENEPWNDFVYQSPILERSVRPGQPNRFEWIVPAEVPPGRYQVSVWFHRRAGNEWVHALGGAFGLAPIQIDRSAGSLPATGPSPTPTLHLAGNAPALQPGGVATLDLVVDGIPPAASCRAAWRLFLPDGGRPVAAAESDRCDRVELAVPPTLAPGTYRLDIVPLAAGPGAAGGVPLTLDVTVAAPAPAPNRIPPPPILGAPRQT